MVGTKQFDHDTVVDRAMTLFWRQGYGGTSIHDLEKATRLRRGSLYNAFGDKQGLFVAALKRYEVTIGQGRITKNLEDAPIDVAYQIPDQEAVPIIFDLLEHEGLCMGGSTGINVAGAIRLAKELGPGHTIVTILADYGSRYQSKLFNPQFLREKGLPVPEWLERKSNVKVPYEKV
jgi:AcrR family transcriptional regulator